MSWNWYEAIGFYGVVSYHKGFTSECVDRGQPGYIYTAQAFDPYVCLHSACSTVLYLFFTVFFFCRRTMNE